MRGESHLSRPSTNRPERLLPFRREKPHSSGDVEVGQMIDKRDELIGFKDYQDKGVEFLESLGMLEEIEGNLIVDLDKLESINSYLLRYGRYKKNTNLDEEITQDKNVKISDESECLRHDLAKNYKDYWNGERLDFLFDIFYERKVISSDDWNDWISGGKKGEKPKPIDLFYNPRTKKDAFDEKKIRESEFYFVPWHYTDGVKDGHLDDYSMFHKGLSMFDVALPCVIFNKRFGDGHRDEEGNLFVRYLRDIKRKKVDSKNLYSKDQIGKMSVVWLTTFGPFRTSQIKKGSFYLNPAQYLADGKFPDLYDKDKDIGLLKPDDFGFTHKSEYFSLQIPKIKISGNDRAAQVMIDNIRYNLGVEYSNRKYGYERYVVYKISDKLAGLVELDETGESEKLVKTFPLIVDKDNLRRVKSGSASGYYSAGKQKLQDVDIESLFLEKKIDETDVEFQQRQSIFDVVTMLNLRRDFSSQVRLGMNHLSTMEQSAFFHYYQDLDKVRRGKLVEFVKNYGYIGLRALLVVRYDDRVVGEILNISDTIDKSKAYTIFEKFSSIIERADNIEEELSAFFENRNKGKSVDRFRVLGELVERASHFLKEFVVNKDNVNKKKIDEIVQEMSGVNEDVIIFASIFKVAFKGEKNIDFSEVKGLDFTRLDISKLDDRIKEQMIKIAEKNWLPRGKAGEGVVGEFRDTLEHGKEIDFYVLKKDGKVVAFIRFDKPTSDGHRYAGSFNVDSDFRGSAIGEAVIHNALNREAEKYILDATVHPEIDVGTKYVEDTGFTIVSTIPNYDNSGVTFFEIVCDRKKNENFVVRQATEEQLISQYSVSGNEHWQEKIGQNIIVLRFDPKREGEKVLSTTDVLIQSGYVISRYFSDPKDKTKRFYVFEKNKGIESHREVEKDEAA